MYTNRIKFFFLLLIMVCSSGLMYAQKGVKDKFKNVLLSYNLTTNNDTINKLYTGNIKEGVWLTESKGGFEEEEITEIGTYLHNKKNGVFRKYTNGMMVQLETYKNDILDGEVKYFESGYIVLRGNYVSNKIPSKDTIGVQTPVQEDSMVVLENNMRSLRDGIWTYYKANGKIDHKEFYYLGELVQRQDMQLDDVTDMDYIPEKNMRLSANISANTDPFAKANKGKKPSRFTQFHEDGKGVKPNVRKPKK